MEESRNTENTKKTPLSIKTIHNKESLWTLVTHSSMPSLEEYIDLLTNGHMALELSIQALNMQSEIISTPFTFVSAIHAIVRNDPEPVFGDISEQDFTIDVIKLKN